MVSGISRWEAKVTASAKCNREEVKGNLKLAVRIGLCPKGYQDMAFQSTVMYQAMCCQGTNDYVLLSVAAQKAQISTPFPMGVWQLEREEGECEC